MIFGKSKMELKLGIFVFIGLVILMIFVLLIGDLKNLVSAYKVNFVFNFINGVRIGAPIRLAGVDVGEIRDIKFQFNRGQGNTKIVLVGLVKNGMCIPKDSQIWVNTLGLMGEKYIEIMPGKNYDDCLKENESMVGNDPLAMQEFGELAKSLAKKLDSSMLEIKDLAVSLKALTRNLDDGISKIKNKEGTVGKLIYDDALYNEINALVTDIKKHPWKLFWKGKEKSGARESD
jgi:phospholipid/cholesterol/gamma-HCH transport system substrate-binding protein